MTWGNKILLVFIAFAGFMGVLVYKCMNQNFELVSKDYYKDELRYQDNIDGSANASKISALQIDQTGEYVNIHFPKELQGVAMTGEAWFYCPVQSSADRKFIIEVNGDGVMAIPKISLQQATYQVKISWQSGNEKYYTEKKISL